MTEVSASAFFNFFLYLLIPFIGGFIAKRFKLQSLIGYILGGLVIGNLFTGLLPKEAISSIANIGIILLLFMVGLEVNFERLFIFKKYIVIGGLLQVGLSLILVALISPLFGFTFLQSILIGIGLSSSSTILVAKIIQERGEQGSFIGEMATGILIFQDLAFIPFIIIFDSLTGSNLSFLDVTKDILLSTLKAAVILSIMYFLGKRIVPLIFDRVAKTSRELLNIFLVLFIAAICYLSTLFGVPVLLSAFIAGILVSQTSEHHHIFSQLRPMRDLMAVIFFVYIGTHIELASAAPLVVPILAFSVVVLLLKFIVILSIFFYFKFNSRITFSLSILLFQIDEDAFILFSIAYANKIFSFEQYMLLISATSISLLLTPLLISRKESIYLMIRSFLKRFIPAVDIFIRHRFDSDPTSLNALQLKNHVVICGYGRVGSHIGGALMNANIPFIAIDFNFNTLQKAKKQGINVLYGDSTDRDILDYAEIEHAAAVISVVPDTYSQEAIILNAKKLNKNIIIISRVHKHTYRQRLRDLGADYVIEPELEASLSIIKRIFHIKGVSAEDRVKHLRHFRLEQGIG